MGLLYPDHPDDSRPGLFEKSERQSTRRNPRTSDRRPTRRREERPSRGYDEPVTNSTTSSELKSLNDLMVRPPTTRRESDRPRKEKDDFRDARREERRERRERRDRMTRDRAPSLEPRNARSRRVVEKKPEGAPPRERQPERSPSPIKYDQPEEEYPRRVRGPRKAERPRHERTSTYESDRRTESTSPRKRRPSYAEGRRRSSYGNRISSTAEPDRSPRRDSRSRYHSRAENDLIAAVPAPPPFTRIATDETISESGVDGVTNTPQESGAGKGNGDARLQWKAPLETILSESHPQQSSEKQPAPTSPQSPERYNSASSRNQDKPRLEREESFVSSYLEGSNLELGTPPPRAYRPAASDDSQSDSEYFSQRRSRRRPRDSAWDEVEYYKYGQAPEDEPPPRRRCCMSCGGWSRRRKFIVIGGGIASVILLIILIAVAASVSNKGYNYKPSDAQVTNAQAFELGGATRDDPNNVQDSNATPVDQYTYYQGPASNFPDSSKWISFGDMWNANLNTLQNSCEWLDQGKNNSPEMIQHIFDAIQDRANASLVDHRFIFATILQESNGCPRVGETKSSGGVRNPGLMQSHNGHVYKPGHSALSIMQMVQDGTQGTEHGDGIVQNLNLYGSPYKAARGYNSGFIPDDGDLSKKSGATKCYVSDIANRLTGWATAESKCEED